MTGVGGVFPNYEDHLLDKKKISECFNGNFHEVLYPINYTSKEGPWQYHSPQDNKHFIDLNSLTWNGKIRVINKNNPSTLVRLVLAPEVAGSCHALSLCTTSDFLRVTSLKAKIVQRSVRLSNESISQASTNDYEFSKIKHFYKICDSFLFIF